MEYFLITFSSTHTAIAAQNYLKGKATFYVMPTLRQISSSCGISVKITSVPYEEIRRLMEQFPADEDMYRIYRIQGEQMTEMK